MYRFLIDLFFVGEGERDPLESFGAKIQKLGAKI